MVILLLLSPGLVLAAGTVNGGTTPITIATILTTISLSSGGNNCLDVYTPNNVNVQLGYCNFTNMRTINQICIDGQGSSCVENNGVWKFIYTSGSGQDCTAGNLTLAQCRANANFLNEVDVTVGTVILFNFWQFMDF